jgi:hypothetical protein
MPFGQRRFHSLILQSAPAKVGQVHMVAYFLPTHDVSAPAEFVNEDDLRAQLAAAPGEALPEEMLALKAFDLFARQKGHARGNAVSAIERSTQATFLDPLTPHMRATVDRFRRLVLLRELPRTVDANGSSSDVTLASSRHDLIDVSRDILLLLDRYLPPPKTPTP